MAIAIAGQPVHKSARSVGKQELVRIGSDLFDCREFDAAQNIFAFVLQCEPGNLAALNKLAILRANRQDLPGAEALTRKLVDLQPDNSAYLSNLGTFLMDQGRYDEAEEIYERILEQDPASGAALTTLGILHLKTGRYARGWDLFRRHGRRAGFSSTVNGLQIWNGEPLQDKSLLIYNDQGLGDECLGARLFARLPALCGTAVVVCDRRLKPLFERSFNGPSFICDDDAGAMERAKARAGCMCVLTDLIAHLAPDLRPEPEQSRYLHPDPRRVRQLRRKYKRQFPGKRLVGISWATAAKSMAASRTAGLELWQDILTQKDCQFFSLQYGADPAEIAQADSTFGSSIVLEDSVDPRNDIDGLAAQIAALDHVISIDNATLHLAGALGKPASALLMKHPHWFWGDAGGRSHWYPKVDLLRQGCRGEWQPVLRRAAKAIGGPGLPHVEIEASEKPASGTGLDKVSPDDLMKAADVLRRHKLLAEAETLLACASAKSPRPFYVPYKGPLSRSVPKKKQTRFPLDQMVSVATDLQERRMWPQAEVLYRYVIAQEPDNVHALSNLAALMASLGDHSEALRLTEEWAALRPQDPRSHANLATNLMDMGRFEDAEAKYRTALELGRENPYANGMLGVLLLRTGRFTEAWPHYLKHKRSLRSEAPVGGAKPWNGEDLTGKSLLVLNELGLGDAFQVARLYPALIQTCSRISVSCDPRLVTLFSRSFPTIRFLPLDNLRGIEQVAEHSDYLAYQTDLIAFGAPDGKPSEAPDCYIKHDTDRAAELRRGYRRKFPGKKLIGFSWSTSSSFKQAARTIPVPAWRELLAREDCRFFSLQYGAKKEDLAQVTRELGVSIEIDPRIDPFNNIDGLAAQIGALDQVISVDNTTVHLAGAMGRPAWNLVMKYPHWLWGLQGRGSAWYPTMRLFRQKQNGDWGSVLREVDQALSNLDRPRTVSIPYRGKLAKRA